MSWPARTRGRRTRRLGDRRGVDEDERRGDDVQDPGQAAEVSARAADETRRARPTSTAVAKKSDRSKIPPVQTESQEARWPKDRIQRTIREAARPALAGRPGTARRKPGRGPPRSPGPVPGARRSPSGGPEGSGRCGRRGRGWGTRANRKGWRTGGRFHRPVIPSAP
ncbi:MAG: hypothetical protein MZU91_00825 [Desulfosudis oleivorans]|nr:hypothetical protein [Desulfosudis oleivorans]